RRSDYNEHGIFGREPDRGKVTRQLDWQIGRCSWQRHKGGQDRHIQRVSIGRRVGCNSRSDAAGGTGMITARTCWPQLWLSRSAITRRTASGVLPAAESEMIVTDLLGYCWACACTWAAADSGSSQKHAIIRECEHNLTFMSPARDQFARTTTRFCTRSLLIVVAQAPPRRSRRIGPDRHSSPPANDPSIGLHWQRT